MSRKSKPQNLNTRYLAVKNISLLEGKDIPAGTTVTDADVFGKAETLLAMGLIVPTVTGDTETPIIPEETE